MIGGKNIKTNWFENSKHDSKTLKEIRRYCKLLISHGPLKFMELMQQNFIFFLPSASCLLENVPC